MQPTPPPNEAARLRALGQHNVLDTAAEEKFDHLTSLAAQICKTPIALISLVDKDRVWFKSRRGLKLSEVPRDSAFCGQAILQANILTIGDARKNPRFNKSPLVISEPYARFYAGVPLINSEGYALGTLCVVDSAPRKLSEDQTVALEGLAHQVMLLLESRRSHSQINDTPGILESTQRQNLPTECEAQLKCIVDYNLTGICFADLNGAITDANDAFLTIVGYTRDDLLTGKLNWREMTAHEHRHLDDQAIEEMRTAGSCAPFEKDYTRKDGSRGPVLFRAALVAGSQPGVVCFSLDLKEHKQAEERVNYFAYHDALTNLPNQALFKDRLQQALSLSRRSEMLAVMLVNLDRFKTINDTLGYVTADQVLREVAERVVGCVRESDTVARFGGDEFAVLLTQVDCTEDVARVAQNIKNALSAPFNFDQQELFVTTSIGICLYPYDAKDSVTLLKNAGTALNRARERDGNNYQFYTSGRTTKALRQLVLENNLRPALERGEFIVHYQPQLNVNHFQLVGTEALVRWQHPVLGLLQPDDFLGVAEDSGLIVSIGLWVLRAACIQNKSWQDAGFAPLRIAVNLSARQFQQPNLVTTVAQVLKDTGLDPQYLELELIEGSVMKEPDQAIAKLNELRAMGVKIAIDDFGTGYSSLSYLKRFPIDTLKVDQSFVTDINSDCDDAAIVAAIITLAHALKLNVIAEGVETQEQLECLQLLKCDEVQGFLFSKPICAEELTQLLAERQSLNSKSYATTPLPTASSVLQKVG